MLWFSETVIWEKSRPWVLAGALAPAEMEDSFLFCPPSILSKYYVSGSALRGASEKGENNIQPVIWWLVGCDGKQNGQCFFPL